MLVNELNSSNQRTLELMGPAMILESHEYYREGRMITNWEDRYKALKIGVNIVYYGLKRYRDQSNVSHLSRGATSVEFRTIELETASRPIGYRQSLTSTSSYLGNSVGKEIRD